MRSMRRSFFTLLGTLSLMACGQLTSPAGSSLDEAWDSANDPRRLAGQYVTNFYQLPQGGQTAVAPWSDYYWASPKGGLAFRWSANQIPIQYQPYSINQIRDLSHEQLARLSPAEKYDIYRGDFGYSLWRSEVQRTAPQREDWAGLCHGWAAASVNFPEPRPVDLIGASGVKIPFAAADIKALLALTQQHRRAPNDSQVLGMRCNMASNGYYNPIFTVPECRDTNAGAFHIVLSNYVGLQRKSFIFDYAENNEVWNFPVTGFYTRVVGEQGWYPAAAPGTARILAVQTVMTFIGVGQPTWGQTGSNTPRQVTYNYTIELDYMGNIIGGEWLSEKRPDFLWVQSAPQFRDILSGVGTIFNASLFSSQR